LKDCRARLKSEMKNRKKQGEWGKGGERKQRGVGGRPGEERKTGGLFCSEIIHDSRKMRGKWGKKEKEEEEKKGGGGTYRDHG